MGQLQLNWQYQRAAHLHKRKDEHSLHMICKSSDRKLYNITHHKSIQSKVKQTMEPTQYHFCVFLEKKHSWIICGTQINQKTIHSSVGEITNSSLRTIQISSVCKLTIREVRNMKLPIKTKVLSQVTEFFAMNVWFNSTDLHTPLPKKETPLYI